MGDIYDLAIHARRNREVADVDGVSYVVPTMGYNCSTGRDAAGLANGFTARKPRRISAHYKYTTTAHGIQSLLFLTVIWARRWTTPWPA